MEQTGETPDILVVDDEPDVARIISLNLEMEGFRVHVAHDGLEALEKVDSSKPDCILLDIMMPEMDGWEVLRVLKSDPAKAEIPVIVVTARNSDVDQIKGFSGGAVEYITKPFDPALLKDYVEKALLPRDLEAEEERRRDRIGRLQLSTIYDITEALISTLEIEEVLEIIAEKLLILFDLDLCAISLLESSGRRLRLACARSTTPLGQDDLGLFSFPHKRLREILKADPLVLSGPQYVLTSELSTRESGGMIPLLRSLYLLPLRAKGKFTGVIYLGCNDYMRFGDEEGELLTAIGNEAAMAIENTRLYDDLRYDEEVHRQLLQRVITAQEDERRRVAIELHDGVIQNVVSALFRLQLCSARLLEAPREVREPLQEAQEIVNDSIKEMRRIIAGLRPTMLDDLGLSVALRKYVRNLQEEAPFNLSIELAEEDIPKLTTEAETTLFRIAQEGLNNILKHSRCRSAVLCISIEGGMIILEIEDDGIGFELPSLQHRGAHNFGLVGMRERAQSLGGSLEIETGPGDGTRVKVSFPLGVVRKEG